MKRISIIAVILSLVFVACKKDDDSSNNNNDPCSNATMSATLDGQQWTGTLFISELIKGVEQGVEGKRLDVWGSADDGSTLLITNSNIKFGTVGDCVEQKTYYGNKTLAYCQLNVDSNEVCETIEVKYSTPQQVNYYATFNTGTVTITACNETDLVISGEFDVTVVNNFIGDSIHITGTFNNQCFTIIN